MPDPQPGSPVVSPEILEKLREYYGRLTRPAAPPLDAEVDSPPLPPQPSMFQQDPTVIGGQYLAQLVRQLVDLDPRVKQRVKRVQFGPTGTTMHDLAVSGLPMDQISGTNMLGGIGPTGDVALNEDLGLDENRGQLLETLAHEFAHAAGYGEHEPGHGAYGTQEFLPRPAPMLSPIERLQQALAKAGIKSTIAQ
jgi:hypothetical protein